MELSMRGGGACSVVVQPHYYCVVDSDGRVEGSTVVVDSQLERALGKLEQQLDQWREWSGEA